MDIRLYKAALFDLDGTLVDNYNAIHSTLAESFSLYGIPEPSYDEVFKTVGGSILITAGKILAAHGNDESLARPICEHYLKIFSEKMFDGLRIMPYAREILSALKSRGIKVACFTNKQQEGADAILEKLGLIESVGAGECVGIGDSPYDYRAARSVGVDSALVATGSDSMESLAKNCPESLGVFENLAKLSESVFGIAL